MRVGACSSIESGWDCCRMLVAVGWLSECPSLSDGPKAQKSLNRSSNLNYYNSHQCYLAG